MQIDDDIDNCLKVLNEGGIILYPTDTIWGLGCDATNEKAVAKIFKIKKRSDTKSMIILVSNETQIRNYVSQKTPKIFDFIKGINKPVTVIYNNAINLASNVIAEDGSVGIRIVDEPFCKRLIDLFGKPIVSTSSNISGYPPPAIFDDIDIEIKNSVDYIVKYRRDETTPSSPSAVIKMNDDYSFTVLRN
ncbi:MAG: threonylcarbamoyl-AMP synthase [Bacteroidetes bacterium]|nr:threonylcarbamoyl-AMP synthase [Bacteroidota bacterium]